MGRRLSIDVPGFGHDNPIPAACKVGPFLISSGVSAGAVTAKMLEGLEAQCAQMFATVRQILEIAGGSPEDIVKMNVWMKDRSQRDMLNVGWLRNVSGRAFASGASHVRRARSAGLDAGSVRVFAVL